VEPFLKKIKFVTFADYKDFLEIQKIDPTISDLSEENNIYREHI
jgi:predicted ATPase with chaperone activity